MQQIIYFFQKFKYFLFFLFLEFIALTLTFNNLNFHKSKFVNSANSLTGGFYNKINSITDYLHLNKENLLLINENLVLKNKVEKFSQLIAEIKSKKLMILQVLNKDFILLSVK